MMIKGLFIFKQESKIVGSFFVVKKFMYKN